LRGALTFNGTSTRGCGLPMNVYWSGVLIAGSAASLICAAAVASTP